MRDAPPPPSDGKPAHPNGREDALAETREVGFRPSVTDIETPLTTMPSAPPAALRAFSDVAASAAGGSKPADLLTALRRAPSRPGGDVLPTEEPGRYTPLGPLGEGGIGCVERVFDRHLRREVALKWLKPRRRRSAIDTVESRFLDEARVTGLLEHPGIMPVYELGRRADGALYYCMKRARGRTLREALVGASLHDRLRLLPRFIALCQAVAYAHSRGVIHRDLKPDNVMLGEYGETLLLDWGLAKVRGDADDALASLSEDADPSQGRTVAGQVLGTPAYMAPEQAQGRIAELDERTDVYALGVILYELLTGEPPFLATDMATLTEQIVHAAVPPPDPKCPAELRAIALRALAKAPADRYPDAGAMAADLSAFAEGGLVGAHAYSAPERIWRFVVRHRMALLMAAAVLAVAIGAWSWGARREADAAAAAEQARLANVAAAADAIVAEARAQRRAGWVELYAARLTALRESLVEQRMIGLLADDDVAMRRLAATALGTMGSRRAVPALTQRLRDGVEPDANVIIAIIRALAVIGDPAAEPAVMAARMVPGSNGYIAQQTVLAYQMLPPMPPENPDDPDAWVNFGVALIEKGRLREGIAAYDEALRLDANNLRALNNRGIAWRRNKQYARALADFDRALAIDPQFAKSLLNRATVQRHLNDLAGSTATLDRLIALADGEGPAAKDARALRRAALSSRAWTLWYANNFPAARADLDAVFAEAPNERQTLAIDGLYWQAAGDLDQAIQRYDRAIDVDSRHPITFQQRARLHEERGDLDAAMADLNEALLLDPDLSQLQAQRARLLLREGKVDAAREAIDAPLSTRPGDAEVYAERAIHFHAAMGDFAAAAADLDRAMERANSGETGLYQLLRLVVARRAGLPAGALAAEVGPPWHRALLDVAAGKHPAADLLAQATSPERRCELDLAAWLTGAALPPPTGFASRPPIALELACPLRERLHAGNQ